MSDPKVIIRTRHLILLGALLAGVLILAAVGYALIYQSQVAQQARDRTILSASSFAGAAADWIREGDRETMSRVAELMLLGSSLQVRVVSNGETLLDRSNEESGRLLSTTPDLGSTDGVTAKLHRRGSLWYFDAAAAIPHDQKDGTSHIQIAADVSFLRGQVAIRSLWVGGSALILWGALAAGLYWMGHMLIGREQIAFALRPADTDAQETKIQRGCIEIDTVTMAVCVSGQDVALTPKQYALLLLLVKDEGKVFSDREIIAEVWPTSPLADANDIRQCVFRLRKRLRQAFDGADKTVVTVKGFGYRFDSGVLDPENAG